MKAYLLSLILGLQDLHEESIDSIYHKLAIVDFFIYYSNNF